MILSKISFPKHQNKVILVLRLLNLDDFSSDFLGLRNLCSLNDPGGSCNLTDLNSLYSPISWAFPDPDPDGLIITGTKMTSVGNFFWNGSSKIQFFTNMVPFLMEAIEAILCYFFENWLMKLKFSNLRNTQIPSPSQFFKVCISNPVARPCRGPFT